MTDHATTRRPPSRARQWAFLCGLTVLLGATAAYVWIQGSVHEAIGLERQLARNVGRIMTLDEILTMSARMGAAAQSWQRLAGRIQQIRGEPSQQHLEVHRSDYGDVVQLVQRRRNHESILTAITAWELDPLQARLERLGESARALATVSASPASRSSARATACAPATPTGQRRGRRASI